MTTPTDVEVLFPAIARSMPGYTYTADGMAWLPTGIIASEDGSVRVRIRLKHERVLVIALYPGTEPGPDIRAAFDPARSPEAIAKGILSRVVTRLEAALPDYLAMEASDRGLRAAQDAMFTSLEARFPNHLRRRGDRNVTGVDFGVGKAYAKVFLQGGGNRAVIQLQDVPLGLVAAAMDAVASVVDVPQHTVQA